MSDWPEWLTQGRLAELEAAAPVIGALPRSGCPCCGMSYADACACPDAAVGLAVLLAARRQENHGDAGDA